MDWYICKLGVFVFPVPRPWPPTLNLYLPVPALNWFLPALVLNLYLPVLRFIVKVCYSYNVYLYKLSVNVLSVSAYVHTFFTSNTFISNARIKLAKNQANAKQHPEAELLLFENYSHSSSMLSSKIIVHILTNKQKKKYVCKNEDKNEK